MPETLSDLELVEARAFAPYVGKKFTSVLDHFRTLIRNAVAHLDPTGNALDGDRFKDIAACEEAEPVLKHIARTMIRAELAARGVNTGTE